MMSDAALLHIAAGDALRPALLRAGLDGAYCGFSDPVCLGPAQDSGELMAWLGQRARFVALLEGADAGEVRLRLGRDYAALGAAPRYAATRLWFGPGLPEQAMLLRVLSLLAGRRPLEGRLWLMPASEGRPFPAMPEAELAALEPRALTTLQLEQAAEAWAAFAAPDPRALDALTRQPLALPFLGPALQRHLRDLPWTTDGLGETERRLLQAVAAGAATEAAACAALEAADPVFPHTLPMLRAVLRRLRTGPRRPLRPQAPLGLTPAGEALLAGTARFRPPPRSHAGVPVLPDPPWLWDPAAAQVRPAG